MIENPTALLSSNKRRPRSRHDPLNPERLIDSLRKLTVLKKREILFDDDKYARL